MYGSSVVIRELDSGGTVRSPYETQPILIVHPNRVLSFPISLERLQLIAGRASQIIEGHCGVQRRELTPGHRPQRQRVPVGLGLLSREEVGSGLIDE